MNKKIIITACIVFALIFVVILAVMMGTISQKGNDANTQLVDTLNSVSGLDLSSYDGKTMKGNVVVNAINNNNNSSSKLFYYVKTAAGDTSVYGYATKNDSGDISGEYKNDENSDVTIRVDASTSFKDYTPSPNDAYHINEEANFKSYLIRNLNDVVIGIYFEQQ